MKFKSFLKSAGMWALRLADARILAIPGYLQPIVETALMLCNEVEGYPGAPSGDWKRANVYSKLIKRYPQESKRDLALAIELALTNHAIKR